MRCDARFPSMNVDGIAAGVHTPDDGWCDPNGLLQGLRRKARSLGVEYIEDRVVGIDYDATAARSRAPRFRARSSRPITSSMRPARGRSEIAAMVGMPLPIEPLRRFEHYFETPNAIEPLPYVKDTARLAFRPEGRGYSGGLVDSDEPRGYNFDVDHDYFERVVWPALAHRFPAFEACRAAAPGRASTSRTSSTAIRSSAPGRAGWTISTSSPGFSGHGMMHAPAAGRAHRRAHRAAAASKRSTSRGSAIGDVEHGRIASAESCSAS